MRRGNFLSINQKHYQDLGSARHQYGISALVTQSSFCEGSSGDLAKRRLFSQATTYANNVIFNSLVSPYLSQLLQNFANLSDLYFARLRLLFFSSRKIMTIRFQNVCLKVWTKFFAIVSINIAKAHAGKCVTTKLYIVPSQFSSDGRINFSFVFLSMTVSCLLPQPTNTVAIFSSFH